ncbi:MAG: type II toxin-antitoxin system mRNA interferase toxin, RelE/StbE family [Patescibacteria group bacterium]
MHVGYSRKFLKNASRLPKKLIALAEEKESLFRNEPHHPSLRTHQLHGKERGTSAFWINYHYRIKFIFLSDNHVLFLDIGPHDLYK